MKQFLSRAIAFLNDVKLELKKVDWPTKEDIYESTQVVLVCIIATTIFILLCDVALSKIIAQLLPVK